MKIIKNSDGGEYSEWDGIDYLLACLGWGLLIFLICLGISVGIRIAGVASNVPAL